MHLLLGKVLSHIMLGLRVVEIEGSLADGLGHHCGIHFFRVACGVSGLESLDIKLVLVYCIVCLTGNRPNEGVVFGSFVVFQRVDDELRLGIRCVGWGRSCCTCKVSSLVQGS